MYFNSHTFLGISADTWRMLRRNIQEVSDKSWIDHRNGKSPSQTHFWEPFFHTTNQQYNTKLMKWDLCLKSDSGFCHKFYAAWPTCITSNSNDLWGVQCQSVLPNFDKPGLSGDTPNTVDSHFGYINNIGNSPVSYLSWVPSWLLMQLK